MTTTEDKLKENTERSPDRSPLTTSYVFDEDTHTFSVLLPEKPDSRNCILIQPVWEQSIQRHFTGAIREEAYVKETYSALNHLGFYNYNSLSCVSLCRDEMCAPFMDLIEQNWKSPFMMIRDEVGKTETLYTNSFVMSSLAGMLFLGVTGLKAAVSHAPFDKDGRQRYIFFAMPHIGISDKGVLGEVERPGHDKPSTACGALVHFHEELQDGMLQLENDPLDVEYSLLKQRLLKRVKMFTGKVPAVKELTDLTHKTILEDLEALIPHAVNTDKADYAVLTGIQIHTPGGASYIWQGAQYAVIGGKRQDLVF